MTADLPQLTQTICDKEVPSRKVRETYAEVVCVSGGDQPRRWWCSVSGRADELSIVCMSGTNLWFFWNSAAV